MRAFISYGLAFVIILGAGVWLATGTLIQGGQGPGNGERPIIAMIEGEEHGPIQQTLSESGVLAEHHEDAEAIDPHLTIAERVAKDNGDGNAASVRITTSTAQAMPIEVPLRGNTKPKATVSVVAETAGTVQTVHVEKGQQVQPGDLLCTLDQGTRAAAVAQAEAALAQAQAAEAQARAELETNAELREKGLAPANTARALETAVASAQSSITAAQAALDNAKAELERTEIHTEVAGFVQDPVASVGSMLAAGAPCATVVQLDPMIFAGSVPESRIGLAKLGLEATINTVTGATASGKVTYISSIADPATRSFPIEIEIANPEWKVLANTTAEATVNLGTAPAHLLPQSVLTLNEEGTLGVRVVEDSKVAFYPITIVKDTREGVWITGLPMTTDVITLGQENVTVGQVVEAAKAEEG